MDAKFPSFSSFLRSSKKTIVLVTITAIVTLIISSIIFTWLSRVANLDIPSIGRIRALEVEAYWDRNLVNKTEIFDWDTIHPGTSRNVTVYLRSISNIETNLYLNTTNWNPVDVSDYLSLSWDYNGTMIHPGEIIEVTFTLSASSSTSFFLYLISNDVEQFSFDIIVGIPEDSNAHPPYSF